MRRKIHLLNSLSRLDWSPSSINRSTDMRQNVQVTFVAVRLKERPETSSDQRSTNDERRTTIDDGLMGN